MLWSGHDQAFSSNGLAANYHGLAAAHLAMPNSLKRLIARLNFIPKLSPVSFSGNLFRFNILHFNILCLNISLMNFDGGIGVFAKTASYEPQNATITRVPQKATNSEAKGCPGTFRVFDVKLVSLSYHLLWSRLSRFDLDRCHSYLHIRQVLLIQQ